MLGARRPRPRVGLAGDHATAMFAVAADRLDWKVVSVAGAHADDIERAIGARPTGLDDLLNSARLDIAIVGTDPERRLDDALRLARRGVHVLVVPGDALGAARTDMGGRGGGRLGVADQFAAAPAVRRWFAELDTIGPVDHLSSRIVTPRHGDVDRPLLDWSLVACTLLSARVLGWGSATSVAGTTADDRGGSETRLELRFEIGHRTSVERLVADDRVPTPPRWELQAAAPDGVLRVDLFPTPGIERNGEPLPLPAGDHPADAFGATAALSTFVADVRAKRSPALGLDLLIEVDRARDAMDGLGPEWTLIDLR